MCRPDPGRAGDGGNCVTEKTGIIRSHESEVTLLQRVVDATWIVLAHLAAHALYGIGWEMQATLATGAAVFLFLTAGQMASLYRAWRASPMFGEAARVLVVWAAVVPIMLSLAFATKVSESFSRVTTLLWFLLAPSFIILSRSAIRAGLRQARRRGRNSRTVAIAGATSLGATLAERIAAMPWTGMHVVGFYDDRSADRLRTAPVSAQNVRGRLEELVDEARSGRVDQIYIALPLRAENRIKDLVQRLADTTAGVHVVADFFVFDLLHAQWSSVQGLPVVSIFESPFYGVNGWLKRLEDLGLGTLILLIIAVPMAFIALGVKLSSPGPVFFRQRRYGLKGEEIHVLKFRTMTVCEDGDHVRQATRHDARITGFGAFLRRTSLDELPQFFHVITGKMSIVGPRPHAVAHNELYRRLIHGYMLRHRVKPGITGWAQVNGWRGETDTVEKMAMRVEHDLHYIRHWGLFFDLKIIWMTVFGTAARRNAY
jgi:putative colanic acid biosysnthesis UDP-glucose lipid carrier transferase